MWLEAPDLVNLTLSYGTCAHKPLVKPFHWRDAVTSFVLFLGSCIASGAGVGGGGLNVAALVFLGDFSTVAAVPLSSVRIRNQLKLKQSLILRVIFCICAQILGKFD